MKLDFLLRDIFQTDRGRAVVLGFGISNRPLCRVLLSMLPPERIVIRDKKAREELDVPAELENAVFITGKDPCDGICDSASMTGTVIFRSPGIRPDSGDLQEAVKRGAILTSEMEWFCDACPGDIFTVTGSDGKTTSTTLTNLLLSESPHRSFVGGNIGTPLLPLVRDMKRNDCAVLELSSFQLFTMHGPAKRAAITNITPNHLNWHKDMDEYIACKYNVFGDRTELLVLNAKDKNSERAAKLFRGHVTFFTAHNDEKDTYSTLTEGRRDSDLLYLKNGCITYCDGRHDREILPISEIKIPGLHNVENFMVAIALTRGYVGIKSIKKIANEFGGVEHRFELVREKEGVKYYNSSIDSTPTRTLAALSNLSCRPVVILGGRDKHVPFDTLAAELYKKASAVVLTGEAAGIIETAMKKAAETREDMGENLKLVRVDDFDEALRTASSLATPGSAVILSPACTSFDRFANFEERGRHFKDIINSL